jgi:hypothetical protein
MAATAAQVLANRENAKKSTGPHTEEGLKRSSLNACKHNLTGGPALAPDEDPAAYQAHLKKFEEDYEPEGDTETFIVRQIADAVWRLTRCSRMEEELMALSANPFAEEDDKVLRRLERLQRYRKSIEGTFHRFRREWIAVNRAIALEADYENKLAQAEYNHALTEYLTAEPAPPSPSLTAYVAQQSENRRL